MQDLQGREGVGSEKDRLLWEKEAPQGAQWELGSPGAPDSGQHGGRVNACLEKQQGYRATGCAG